MAGAVFVAVKAAGETADRQPLLNFHWHIEDFTHENPIELVNHHELFHPQTAELRCPLYKRNVMERKPLGFDKLKGIIRMTDQTMILLDDAIAQKPRNLDALLALLIAAGCDVKRGKHISIRGPGQTRFKRLGSLGEE